MKKAPKKSSFTEKDLLVETEKFFRRIWEKERKVEDLFKKSAALHEQAQILLAQEFCKPENEQSPAVISSLRNHIHEAEATIDTIASLTGELHDIRECFYESLSSPEKNGTRQEL